MTLESVGEQYRRAVAFGWLMSDEEKAREKDQARLFAQAKFDAQRPITKISLAELIESEELLQVFDRLRRYRQTESQKNTTTEEGLGTVLIDAIDREKVLV